MNKSLNGSKIGDIFKINYRIWRAMPVVASIWLGIPLILGILVVISYGAQRKLVDLFVVGAHNRGWTEWFGLAMLPISVFTAVAVLNTVFMAIHNIIDSKLRDQASLLIQSEVHQQAINVPLERMDHPEYYDRLQRAELVAGTDLFGLLQNFISIVRLFFEFMGLLIVVFMVRFADRIVVLQNGRIIEEGSHETLLMYGCKYAVMFRAQAQWYGK